MMDTLRNVLTDRGWSLSADTALVHATLGGWEILVRPCFSGGWECQIRDGERVSPIGTDSEAPTLRNAVWMAIGRALFHARPDYARELRAVSAALLPEATP
jgi:hypothetical protein